MPRYALYGLSVECDRPLPALDPATGTAPPDARMWLGSVPAHAFPDTAEDEWYVSPREVGEDEPSLVVHRSADGERYRLRYADGVQFWMDRRGTAVACTWPHGLTLEDAATYLLGSISGLLLRFRGTPALHASALAVDNAALAVCGPAQAGKSTTAAALSALGCPVLADDVVPLLDRADGLYVQPAYPHLRLWPDVVPALFGAGAHLPALTPTWEKRYLDVQSRFQPTPLPLRAVYVLAGRETENAPRLEPVPPVDAVLTLVANGYMGWFPDAAASAREFAVLSKVARTVPVIRVVPNADPARVGELAAALRADFRQRLGGTDG